MTTSDRIRAFIVEQLGPPIPARDLHDDLPLIEEHIIDSMAIFQIIDFLEGEFGIEILDEELLTENFASIAAMARLVDSKGAGSA